MARKNRPGDRVDVRKADGSAVPQRAGEASPASTSNESDPKRGPQTSAAPPAEPAVSSPTGLDAEDARNLKRAAIFVVCAVAFIVALKLLLGW